jgi:energy-coupling factor transporter ATP-binding protein EcfA2
VSDFDRSNDSGRPAGTAVSPIDLPSGPAAPGRFPDVPSIELDGVTFEYPDGTRALDGVSLRIEPGEEVAIVGQNGSGKSTLAKHLNGLLRPVSGRVLLGGRDIRDAHVAGLAGQVGLAFQNPDRQLFAGRVSAEVEFGPRNLGLRGAELQRAVASALEAVGLAGEAAANPYDLGYSRRKLLAIASVLAMRTPVLVFDEPTTGQDARGVACVRSVVAGAVAEGRTVIAISHDMRFVAECFGRVVAMRAGRVILDGSPSEVFAESHWPELSATYLEPPVAAVVGARLGLGSTPTASALIAAAAAGAAAEPRSAAGRRRIIRPEARDRADSGPNR